MKARQKITYGWVVVTLAVVAGVLTVALTGVAFWLSYEHLHDVAGDHGLVATSARSWAWPATLDTFIVIGELLVLRASLLGKTDLFAIFLAGAGSAGSITLNVVGVEGAAGPLDYVVAGVPPVAALLAFAALMRQVHGAVKRYLADAPVKPREGVPVAAPEPPALPPVPIARPVAPAPEKAVEPIGPLGEIVSDLVAVVGTERRSDGEWVGKPHDPVVYFLRNGDRVKIGTSTNIVDRSYKLTLHPNDVVLLLQGGTELETRIHERFKDQRLSGTEWFRLSGDLKRYLDETDFPGLPGLSHRDASQKISRRARGTRAAAGLVPPEPDPSRDLLTTTEAAGLAGVPASTIRTWKARGKGGKKLVPAVDTPDVLYSRDSVLQFIGASK